MKRNKIFLYVVILTIFSLNITGKESRGEEYAGPQVCAECHEGEYESFLINSHAVNGDPLRPGAGFGCESCHGPGSAHAEDEDIEKIISLGPRTQGRPEMKNAMCLQCHENGRQILWSGSEHESRGLSCSDCHTIHGQRTAAPKGDMENKLCIGCHKQIRTEMLRQSSHPIAEGKILCRDCHNPHGTVADKLVDAQTSNIKCFECHADKRGPFIWEHPSVSEDCLVCHTPHGSTHRGLLKGRTPYLCQRCHSDQVHSSTLYARNINQSNQSVYRSLTNISFYRACLNCHVGVHGSNHPSGKSLLR